MATFTKVLLAGSGVGEAIKIVNTSSPGTNLHSTETSASIIDELWLYAYNSDTTARLLTIQWTGTATPDNDIKVLIPSQSGLTLVVPGLIARGTGSAQTTIRAYASAANVITISGYVNRIS